MSYYWCYCRSVKAGVVICHTIGVLVDLSGRGIAVSRARKRAHQLACEDAFSRILLVTVPGGKVYVEVNTTVEDRLHHTEGLNLDTMLTVRLHTHAHIHACARTHIQT